MTLFALATYQKSVICGFVGCFKVRLCALTLIFVDHDENKNTKESLGGNTRQTRNGDSEAEDDHDNINNSDDDTKNDTIEQHETPESSNLFDEKKEYHCDKIK